MKTVKKHAAHGITQFELSKKILNNLSQFDLKPITKLVLLYLCDCYNPKKPGMFPKQSTIAKKLGVSEASVIRAVSELHKEGLIVSERKYTNLYKFTSKIVGKCPQDDFLCEEEMQDENNQNEISSTCKMQPHEHEQTKERNKETNLEDFKILKEYAIKMGAKNIKAYVNKLIKSGSAKAIIEERKQIQANAQGMAAKAQKVIKDLEFARANRAEEIPQIWFEMKKTVLERMQNKQ